MKQDIARIISELLSPEVAVVLSVVLVGLLIYIDRDKYRNMKEVNANHRMFLVVKVAMFFLLVIAAIDVIFFR
jgi:hypothetical protein